MISVYAATASDYSSNGLLILDPYCKSGRIREKLNGEYTLTLELEVNARTVEVVNEMVIKVPAPVRFTPQIDIYTPSSTEVWKVWTNTRRLSLRTKPSTQTGRVLHAYKKGTEVIVKDKTNSDWYIVVAPDGRSGYMEVRWLQYVRTEYDAPVSSGIVEEHKTREQLFRVRSVSSTLDGITVEAQHISYDLRRNYIKSASTKGKTGAAAFAAMMAATVNAHEFNAYSDITGEITEDITRKNPISALLSDGGLIEVSGGELLRDNFDLYWVERIGRDRGVSIAYRKNMAGMDIVIDTNDLITRIIPIGYDKKNNPIYGDSVDSQYINDYAQPYVVEYEYKDVKVGNEGYSTAADVKAEIERRARLEYDNGIDMPTVTASVDYVDLQNTDVGKSFAAFNGVFLGDTIRIRHEDYRFDFATNVNAYEWDVLLNEYVSIDLGSRQATLSDVRISPSQIGNSMLAGRKLAVGTVSGVELGEGSVSGDHITDDAVGTRHIVAASVTTDKLAAKSITTDKLAAGAITAETIAANAITADKLSAGAVTAEKIASKSITAEQIAAGTITAESGIIADSAIGTAQIADGSITSAKVVELSADVIKAGTLSAERLVIVGEDGIIYRLNAASSGLSLTELSQDQYSNYINGTVIVAKSITAAQIAAKTITGNEILAGSITAKEIDVSDLFAAEATIQALNAMDITGNTYLRLMVADALDSVQVGGTNYLRDSASSVSNSAYNVANYYFSDDLKPKAGETVTVRIWGKLGSGRTNFGVWNTNSAIPIGTLTNNGDGTHSGTFTWKITSANYPDQSVTEDTQTCLRVYAIPNDSAITASSAITRIKLEAGNKATAWSPHPEEFKAGSAVLITEEEVRISTPEFNVEIVGDDGETNMLSIDEDGAQMQSLTAPDVTPRYKGPATLYVNPSATAAQIAAGNYYRSLADALAALHEKWVDRAVRINLAAGMVEYGTLSMSGVSGGNWIYITGDSAKPAKLVGRLNLYYNTSPVEITYLDVDSDGIGFNVAGCSWVQAGNCVITGPGTDVSGSYGVYAYNGTCMNVYDSEIYDSSYSLMASRAGNLSGSNNKGNCRVRALRSTMYLQGTQPCDSTTWTVSETAGKVYAGSVTVDQGSKPTPETVPTTVTVGASATDSYYSASGAWINQDNVIRQGYYSGMGEWAGCMWFPTTSFSGKTVKSASLTLTRTSGSGRSSDVTLTLYGITLSSASGNPHTGRVSYGALGTIGNGETKTFTLPLAAAQALAGGAIKGFMLYANDGAVMSGRSYSYNYCKITSTLSSAGVLGLSVTY